MNFLLLQLKAGPTGAIAPLRSSTLGQDYDSAPTKPNTASGAENDFALLLSQVQMQLLPLPQLPAELNLAQQSQAATESNPGNSPAPPITAPLKTPLKAPQLPASSASDEVSKPVGALKPAVRPELPDPVNRSALAENLALQQHLHGSENLKHGVPLRLGSTSAPPSDMNNLGHRTNSTTQTPGSAESIPGFNSSFGEQVASGANCAELQVDYVLNSSASSTSSSTSSDGSEGRTDGGNDSQRLSEQLDHAWTSPVLDHAELKIQGLGLEPLEISLTLNTEHSKLEFRTDHPQGRELLQQSAAELQSLLQSEGIAQTDISVALASSDSGSRERQNRSTKKTPWSSAVLARPAITLGSGTGHRMLDCFA